jgi:hypothetical protein
MNNTAPPKSATKRTDTREDVFAEDMVLVVIFSLLTVTPDGISSFTARPVS